MTSLRIAVQMDPIEKMIVNHDTSLALMVEAQSRGHEIWWWSPDDLFYELGAVKANARRVSVSLTEGAHYQTQEQAIRAVDATHFEADATLTLRDKTVALKFPFNFEPNADGARLKAKVTLDRLAFGIGTGDWADESMIGHQVEVNVDLSLVKKS